MDHETQVRLVERALAHIERRTTDAAERPATQPVAAYLDEARHAREVERIVRGLPVVVAHASQLRSPGDFVTHDASGVPLLVTRQDDGGVAAFINVCRHRGTRVEGAPCGQRKAFVCPYHAWSYARDGRLLGVPHESGFAGIEASMRGLVRVPATEAAGLVWARASAAPAREIDVAAWLGPIVADLDRFGVATGRVYGPRAWTKAMNWKLAVDVFLETYHFRVTHKDTIYPIFFDNLGLVEPIGPHLRNVFPKRSITELASRPKSEWSLREHANILYYLFPNTFVLVQPDHVAVIHVWPDGPSRTQLSTYMLIPDVPEPVDPVVSAKARAHWEKNEALLYATAEEDYAMGESIQRGLVSGANRELVFGAFEHALTHFHAEVERRLGAP